MSTPHDKIRTSLRLTKAHQQILKTASKLSGKPGNELTDRCLTRSILRCGHAAFGAKRDEAIMQAKELMGLVTHIPKPTQSNKTPTGIYLQKDALRALATIAEGGRVTHTDVLTTSIEHEIVEVVLGILVEQKLTRDTTTVRTMEKWVAHLTKAPVRHRNGAMRLLQAIAADSSRKITTHK